MGVDSIQSTSLEAITSQSTTSTQEQNDTWGQDEFLKVFMAQLEYQDPLDPMETADMTSQLCLFAMLEQQYSMSETLEEISTKLDDQTSDNLLDYIGKEIVFEGRAVTIEDGEVLGSSYALEEPAYVEIIIYDSEGSEVNHLYLGKKEAGSHTVDWNGEDSEGVVAEDGIYSYTVTATDDSGGDVSVTTTYTGKVSGVSYQYDSPYLKVEDMLVDPEAIIEVLDSTVE
jgi:flagellar basal-body rod modification protein FlgD